MAVIEINYAVVLSYVDLASFSIASSDNAERKDELIVFGHIVDGTYILVFQVAVRELRWMVSTVSDTLHAVQ